MEVPLSWLLLRLLKFAAMALFSAGLAGAALSPRQRDRLFAAHWLAAPGLFGTWIAGYGLMKSTGLSLREPWISWGMLASLVALQGALLAAQKPEGRPWAAGLAAAGFVSATAAMVDRGAGTPGIALGVLVPLACGLFAAWVARVRGGEHVGDAAEARAATLRWFTWVARFEGASLLFMLGVSMPLRKLAGISIDGGEGWVGWVHGMLTLVYLQALVSAARADGWGVGRAALGFVASLVPFGTFLFERRLARGVTSQAST